MGSVGVPNLGGSPEFEILLHGPYLDDLLGGLMMPVKGFKSGILELVAFIADIFTPLNSPF